MIPGRFITALGWAILVIIGCGIAATRLPAQDTSVTITIDAAANRHAISPLIYGVANASSTQLAELNAPLHRLGGNHTSRYNWQANAYNRANDWYFESVGEPTAVAGESGDTFVANANAAGAQPMLTIPMQSWVARLGSNRGNLSSFSIAKYGAQTGRDTQFMPDAGNGVRSGGAFVTNDPSDANVAVNSAFQQAWVRHLVDRWGGAAHGGPRYYILDNEPGLWHSTHRDVHPDGATMEEVRSKMIEYGTAVKAADPDALIVGPEEWGWLGYIYSGHDEQWADKFGWGSALPDRSGHGGSDYLPWLLDQLRQYNADTGRHVLDVFSVHYYPEGGVAGSDVSSTTQLLRNRSTRSLWDPNYRDESWIAAKISLIPRLREWADGHYAPGTPIAITEYNWGAETHISGAIAQADVLGIFGREGLDMATRWGTPNSSTPTFKAIKLYRNYDGHNSAFGDISVGTVSPNPDEVAAFAALRSSDGALTVMVLNKSLSVSRQVTLNMAGISSSVAHRWQLTADNTLTQLADLNAAAGTVVDVVPRQSVTLFVLSPK